MLIPRDGASLPRGSSVVYDMGLENPLHILILAVVIILIFGAKRLPQIGRSLGSGIREVKSAVAIDEIAATASETRKAITATTATAAPGDPLSTERPLPDDAAR